MNFVRRLVARKRKNTSAWSVAAPISVAVACFYFAFYLFFGPNGVLALGRVGVELAEKQAELAILSEKHAKLASDIALMRPDNLDRDMADEQVRKTLGYTKPDEIVIHFN